MWGSRLAVLVGLCFSAGVLGACGGQEATSKSTRPLGAARVVSPAIPAGQAPVALAVGAGHVWVADQTGGTVLRIDLRRRERVGPPIAVGSAPFALTVGADAVWVAGGNGQIRSVDPRTARVTGRPVRIVGANGIAVGAGGVWVTSRIAGTVTRIDPRTRRPGSPIRVGAGPANVTVAFGSVWVANAADGSLSRIDPTTMRADPPIPVGGRAVLGLAAGEDALWLARGSGEFLERIEIVRVDPQSREVDDRSVAVKGAVPMSLAAGDGSVWATDVGGVTPSAPARPGSVSRIDPRGPARAGRPIPVGNRPSAVVSAPGGAWVANTGDGTVTFIAAAR